MAEPPVPAPAYAIIPSYADIKPPRAFVSAMPVFGNAVTSLDVHGKNITSISAALLNNWTSAQGQLGNNGGDFSNNNLDATTISRILTSWATFASHDLLDISGGTNAEPAYQPEVYVTTLPVSLPSNGTMFNINYDGTDLEVKFNTGIALGSSSVLQDLPEDQWLQIGISGSPTNSAIATKVAALWDTIVNKRHWTITANGSQLTFSKSFAEFGLMTVPFNTANFTINSHTVGSIDSTLSSVIDTGTVSFSHSGQVVTISP